MKSWFQSLAPRERVLVITCGVVVIVFMLYQLVWMPTVGQVSEVRERLASEKAELQWFREKKALLEALEKRSGGATAQRPPSMTLQTVINNSAKQKQINLERFQSSGDDEVTVWVEEAPLDKLLLWLQDLEQRYGVTMTSATIGNEGQKPGVAKVRIRLKDGVQ